MSGCERYLEMIEEHIDGMLNPAGRRDLLAHMEECPTCRAEFRAGKALVERLESLEIIDPGDEFTQTIMARLFAPELQNQGVLQKIHRTIDSIILRHRRLAWSPLVFVSLLAAVVIPSLLKTGVLGALKTGSDVVTFLVNPLASMLTSLDHVVEFAGPFLRAIYLVLGVFARFLFTLAGTQQISFVLIGSVIVVMTAGILMFFRITLAKRRMYYAELRV